jgi:hypothetical protein
MSIYNKDTELIFPTRVIPSLKGLKGELWDSLIEEISNLPDNSDEKKAFVLMMANIGNCGTCSADSFRAMRGCTQCANQNISRHKDSEKKLVSEYQKSLEIIMDL